MRIQSSYFLVERFVLFQSVGSTVGSLVGQTAFFSFSFLFFAAEEKKKAVLPARSRLIIPR